MSATMNGGSSTQQQQSQPPSSSNAQPVVVTPSELAAMLRKSADIVERNEFHPLLYQTMRVLTAYAAEYAENASATQGHSVHSSGGSVSGRDGTGNKNRSAFHDVPDSVLDGTPNTASHSRQAVAGATAAAMRPAGGQFNSAANTAMASAGSSVSSTGTTTTAVASKSKSSAFILKGIKKGLQKIGEDLFVGDNHHTGKDEMPFDETAWCDEHFTRGCACKSRSSKGADNKHDVQPQQSQQQQVTSTLSSSNPSDHDKSPPQQTFKPCFQRPINPSSNLIANGWIDQQRRSKMRVVWKDVLASLVEGRRPGEETTLWIQRQVVDPSTGKVTGLEALHQVPMKWLEDVNYVDIYGDHRFTLKVYNIAEEFYFRTRDEQSAQSWVLTLRSARDASLESGRMGNNASATGAKPSTKEVGGMGLNNLDDWDNNSVGGKQQQQQQSQGEETDSRPASANSTHTQSPRMTISELRALAHSAGYDTRGMERQDLEKIAALVRSNQSASGHAGATSQPSQQSAQELDARAQEDTVRKRKEAEERLATEQMMRQKEEAEKRRSAAEAEQRRRKEEEAAVEMRKRLEEEQRKRQEEEQRRRQEEEQRRRQEEEHTAELRKKLEEEQRKRQEEERQRQVEQQTAQINLLKQRQDEERRKRVAELQAAEVKRMQEEERRRQQQQTNYNSDSSAGYRSQQQQYHPHQQQQSHFQQQQQQQQPPNSQFFNPNIPQGYPQQGFHGHQQTHQQPPNQQFYNQNVPYSGPGYPQQPFQGHPQPNPHQQNPPQQQPPQGTAGQGASAKYMEDKTDELQSAFTLQIKRNILIHWALQPPNLNVLRPIDQLITTIHTAMPPAYGVSAHDYFARFTPITRQELFTIDSMSNHLDETKLKKAVRKVRVFLHPDKLPRDLSSDQSFMARMLWDITSDSWEEFLKHKDELDWIRS